MSQKITPLCQSIQLLDRDSQLRKIKATDCFPCYQCYDQRIKRDRCKVCNYRGYLRGDHPMVQFIEQFIEKKIKIPYSPQMRNSSLTSQGANKRSLNHPYNPSFNQQNKQKKDMPRILQSQSYRQDEDSADLTQSNCVLKSTNDLFSSVKPQNYQVQHIGFYCDCCGMDPIIGPRYNCKKCKDYDLCKNCFKKNNHEHQVTLVQKINLNTKPRAQLLESLRQSMHKSRR